jgi:hypothetical protein
MRDVVRRSTELQVYEPDPAADRWNALYDRFRAVVDPKVVAR